MRRKVGGARRRATTCQVAGRAVEAELERAGLAHVEPGPDRRHEADRDIGLALGQVDQMPLGHQLDQDVRMLRIEGNQLLREIIGGDALHGGKPHPAGRLAGSRLDGFHDRESEPLHLLGDGEQAVAVLGQHEAVRLALEQLDGEVLFKLGNAPADGGVVDLEPPRRGHEAALPGQLEKEHQIVPVEHRSSMRPPFGAVDDARKGSQPESWPC